MNTTTRTTAPLTPHAATTAGPPLTDGPGDHLTGFGVMGIPFGAEDYLALRCWPESSFGPGYRSIWHHGSAGWTIYSDASPALSCARFVGSAAQRTVTTPIGLTWQDEASVVVHTGTGLAWTMRFGGSQRTALLNACAGAIPGRAWNTRGLLTSMGLMVGPLIGGGRLRMIGTMPNGQRYRIAARHVWIVTETAAEIEGRRLEPAEPDRRQQRLGPLWLPRRGFLYALTTARFTN
ncbi:hypothetical protein GCG21_11705 [Pseudactinotalea sp. HY160]|uniref:hypothetical protein n=1 Tax=Pseudactinotalea sp. HY160 TaxID=2654490 RepID=UPI00128C1C31|nr:hypothetical protein [Pseudactinotalea sp. HY160]MPV50657.1 hypothetical protein [Pseudactinotalea sp. HY160]